MHIRIDGIEPRGKSSMPQETKRDFQLALLSYLQARKRRAFRGKLALKIWIETSARTPSMSPSIAKNLIDLMAKPLPQLQTNRKGLLYYDDRQIDVLSVSCRHGQDKGSINVSLEPLNDMLDSLMLAWNSGTYCRSEDGADREFLRQDRLDDFLVHEQWWRDRIGDSAYEEVCAFARRSAQESVLTRATLQVSDIVYMFREPDRNTDQASLPNWTNLYASALLRIKLNELPQVRGQSEIWKAQIRHEIAQFRDNWRHLLTPLLVPVALEVVVRPAPKSRRQNTHDLDNIVRDYLLPRVLEVFEPPSSFDFSYPGSTRIGMPPASTRVGVTRYEVWRLPDAPDHEEGFVTLALAYDHSGYDSVLTKIHELIDDWHEALD